MDKFATFEDENPIIQPQAVESEKGFGELANVFGEAAKGLAKQAENMASEQSNIMYLHSQAFADKIKTDSQIKMIQDPGNAIKIAESAKQEYANMVSQTPLNDEDRARLRKQAMDYTDDIDLQAVRTNRDTVKYNTAVALATSWPDQLRIIKQSANNPEQFEQNIKSAMNLVYGALRTQSITPEQAGRYVKSINVMQGNLHSLMGMVEQGGAPAAEHNRLNQVPLNSPQPHDIFQKDENTAMAYTGAVQENTVNDVKAAAARGEPINPVSLIDLPENKFNSASSYISGANSVDAHNVTGTSVAMMENRLTELNGLSALTNYEKGQRDRLKNIIGSFKHGDYWLVMKDDPHVKEAIVRYGHRKEAIQSNAAFIGTDGNLNQEGNSQLRSINNAFVDEVAAAGYSRHLSDNFVRPVPYDAYVVPAMTAFDQNGNPNDLIGRTAYWNSRNREYYAREFPDPEKQEIVRMVGNLIGKPIMPGDMDRVILANQKGRDYSVLKVDKVGNSKITAQLDAKLSDVYSYIGKQYQGDTRINAMSGMMVNYVKMLAMNSGDFTMVHLGSYVDQAAKLVKQAYPIENGVSWSRSANDLSNLNNVDMDWLANYCIDDTKINLLGKRLGAARMSANTDANPLSVVVTPTGYLHVRAADGTIVNTYRYSDGMLSLAKRELAPKGKLFTEEKRRQLEEQQERSLTMESEKFVGGAL